MKVVEIVWRDACRTDAILPLETALKVEGIVRRNVGYLLGSTTLDLIISFGDVYNLFSDDKGYDIPFAIPRDSIDEINILREDDEDT